MAPVDWFFSDEKIEGKRALKVGLWEQRWLVMNRLAATVVCVGAYSKFLVIVFHLILPHCLIGVRFRSLIMKYNLKNNAQNNRNQLLENPNPNNASSVHGCKSHRLDQPSLSTSIVASSSSASASAFNCDDTYSGPVMLDFGLQTVRHVPYEYSDFNKENRKITSRQLRARDAAPSKQTPVPLPTFFSTHRLKRSNVTNSFDKVTRKRRKTAENTNECSNGNAANHVIEGYLHSASDAGDSNHMSNNSCFNPARENTNPATHVTTHPTQRCFSPSGLQISSDDVVYSRSQQPHCHATKGIADNNSSFLTIAQGKTPTSRASADIGTGVQHSGQQSDLHQSEDQSPVYEDLGDCNKRCRYCNAAFWHEERLKGHREARLDHFVLPVMTSHVSCNCTSTTHRMSHFTNSNTNPLDPQVVQGLIQFLDTHNELVQVFRTARDKCAENDVPEFKVRLYNGNGALGYELPTSQAIGAIVFDSGPTTETDYDIVIEYKDGPAKRINKLHQSYMSLQFPLIFIYGQPRYHIKLMTRSVDPNERMRRVSMNAFYTYQLHPRHDSYNLLFRTGRLFQQYVVGVYCCLEQNRMDFYRTHQDDIRGKYLSGLYDAVSRGDHNGSEVGSRIILPSSFTGGPRYMYSHYLDALAICRELGNPQFFITFTCNANWPEIRRYMADFPQLSTSDRADVICRVFEQKLKAFVKFLKQRKPFGNVTGVLYTIEFQKRGLPHCHTLLWVSSSTKVQDAKDVDQYISAELPVPVADPRAYKIVSEMMMHGPCGKANLNAPCMEGDKCTKNFPKKYNNETFFDDKGHVHYRRRQRNIFATKNRMKLDNSYVVPYNRSLCLKFAAHINVEYCGWSMLIKYLFKYISKGTDRIFAQVTRSVGDTSTSAIRLQPHIDEIQNFVDGHFICSPEACWRILKFQIHSREPAVEILQVHLENMQHITFRDGDNLEAIVNHQDKKMTTLTEWFTYNIENTDGHHLTYLKFPSEFVWHDDSKAWTRRKNNCHSIGRLAYVHPTSGDPIQLWNKFWKEMGHDIPGIVSEQVRIPNYYVNDAELQGYILYELEILLTSCGKSVENYGLQLPPKNLIDELNNRLLMEEKNYNRPLLAQERDDSVPKLNPAQKRIYDLIINTYTANRQELIFVYGHGGTGKTFLWKTVISALRSEGKIVLAIASSGIASLLLPSGRTAHSRFKLPLELTDESLCEVKKNTLIGNLLAETHLIIWDEAPMNDRRCFEALDITLRDILDSPDVLFGGKTIVLGGDFRQTLLVKKGALKMEIIASSIARSHLWPHFRLMTLKENMRLFRSGLSLEEQSSVHSFASWLLDIGDGKIGEPDEEDGRNTSWVEIPERYCIEDDEEGLSKLIDFIYDKSTLQTPSAITLQQKAIVCPKNQTADIINSHVLSMIEGETTTYASHDVAIPVPDSGADTEMLYPDEYLNTFNLPGFPPHLLELKVGAPVMLLRNVTLAGGLCNGTRMIVTQLMSRLIEVQIITGTRVGEKVFIYRIPLIHTDPNLPFLFKRHQFPIKLCYAMTINKSQGQSLNKIGVYLPEPVFGHGQLYVALSRATSPHGLKILMKQQQNRKPNETKNIVYRDFLAKINDTKFY
ncbi:hypothetical protein CTI12_AA173420 [Artemisia annua]|uniref:ATP-dependent DNA helicase n=1 Tax=Artemisia annua TaxID=35608 RepID=A0A2U1PBA1_ARTAN|nr:hypothetical protein CTI12_AA173420 [Artemisia annua]